MTGAPGFLHRTKGEGADPADLWKTILHADYRNHIMAGGVGSGDEDEAKALDALGLVPGHAYGVIGCAAVEDINGNKAQIVQLRNPWGRFEWRGDWGDESELWSPEAKEQVNFVAEDDGTFWMSLTDFVHYFTVLFVCKYNDDCCLSSTRFEYSETGHYLYKMQVKKAGEYTIAVSQKDKRCFPRSSEYRYSSCSILVAQNGDNGKLHLVKGHKGFMDRDAYVEFEHLDKGVYYVWVRMDWDERVEDYEDELAFTLNAYGVGRVTFASDPQETEVERLQFLETLLTSVCDEKIAAEGRPLMDDLDIR